MSYAPISPGAQADADCLTQRFRRLFPSLDVMVTPPHVFNNVFGVHFNVKATQTRETFLVGEGMTVSDCEREIHRTAYPRGWAVP